MSTLKVEIVQIDSIEKHPNADKLEISRIAGWQCVTQKGRYKAGDKVIYLPVDSILPNDLEAKLFPPDSKIKLDKSRIRAIKIRQALSEGMIIPPEEFGLGDLPLGTNVQEKLGIKKYEPPTRGTSLISGGCRLPRISNKNFKKYTEIENLKNYPRLFEENELVSVTEKIHGSNARVGWVLYDANTWWKKILKIFLPKWEFVFGSHNIQLKNSDLKDPKTNIWAEIVLKYDLKNKLGYGEVIYGEIYGDGIQKNYSYGCKSGEHKLGIFDVMLNGKYLHVDDFFRFCIEKNLPTVKEIYTGPFNLEKIKGFLSGDSIMEPTQKIIEGAVIKPLQEQSSYTGRKILKLISDNYALQKGNTEYH